jgi:hypothetical protein
MARRRSAAAVNALDGAASLKSIVQRRNEVRAQAAAAILPGRGGDTVSADALHHLGDMEEIRIGFRRPDGSTRSVPIWIVQVGDHIYVRSVRGPKGGWYRRLRANPNGEVRDGAYHHLVRAEAVTDAGTLAQVTRAYEEKYGGSPFVRPLLAGPSVEATLRLDPV